jgi:hypothetical protein
MNIPYADRLVISSQFLSWMWVIVPIMTSILLMNGVRKRQLNQYILAATLLVALAGIPFTGWILGYFVSAWMLERTTWLYPFGISAVFLVLTFQEQTYIGRRFEAWKLSFYKKNIIGFTSLLNVSIWLFSIIMTLLVMRERGLPNITRLQNSTLRYQELVLIGQQIDRAETQPVNVAGTDELNDFIPALSWKAKVISYRPEDLTYPYYHSEEEKLTRWTDRQAIFQKKIPPDERMEIIQKYDIQYLLLESNRYGKVKDLISTYPLSFKTFTFGRYHLIEINNDDNSTG